MGIYYDAELIWGVPVLGVPVLAFEEDEWGTGDQEKPSPLWDTQRDDWRSFEHLEVVTYGHYDDPDNKRGILTVKGVPAYNADCWRPVGIDSLLIPAISIAAVDEALQVKVNFVDAKWYLTCSVG